MEELIAFLNSFYSKSRANVALYNTDKTIIWNSKSNENSFFPDNLDELATDEELSKDGDTSTVMLGGEVVTIKTFPYKTKEGESFYLCEAYLLNDFLEEHYPLISHGMRKASSVFRQQIFGVINLASSLYASCEKFEMYEEIAKLNSQIGNCYLMLKQLMNISEVTRFGKNHLKPKLVDISKLAEDIANTCNTLIRGTGKKIIFESTDKDTITSIDDERFVVALMNVISNSLAYSSKDAIVQISVRRIKDVISITVNDNGYGIENDILEKVFMPFFSVSQEKAISDNLGLGLFIAKNFTEHSGGSIILSSKLNEGTSVTMRFPVRTGDSSELYLESKTAEYVTNRYSPIYLALSDVCDLNFYS
ncbi:MAG: HAMP domain-containing histidine kinase [Clostridiales bacterium]|nr:HAMP domain-containing histidine kinase [Clostridiales bacterium]